MTAQATAATTHGLATGREHGPFITKLNTTWHRRGMWLFLAFVLAHWGEHIVQAIQIWVLHWKRPDALGIVGLWFPELVRGEYLHYFYAVGMLIGFIILLPGMVGRARTWWKVALAIQVWHHFEHLLLFGQALLHENLLGKPVPTSIVQLMFERVELHLFYNAIVFIPMLIAMYYHLVPPRNEVRATCSCAIENRLRAKQPDPALAD